MKMGRKVNFFIVGAAKAGTTTIYRHLEAHHRVCMCAIKEPNYFSGGNILADRLYYKEPVISDEAQYEALFKAGPEQDLIGEASVSYLYYPGTAAKIRLYNPEARILILLRNPAERAFSHYLMDQKLGLAPESFERVLEGGTLPELRSYFQQYVLYGLYYRQVKEYLETFGKEQVLVVLFEEVKHNLPDLLSRISTFLSLTPAVEPLPSQKYNEAGIPEGKWVSWLYRMKGIRKFLKDFLPVSIGDQLKKHFLKTPSEQLSVQSRKWLRNYYLDDIRKLEKLTGQNLSSWYE